MTSSEMGIKAIEAAATVLGAGATKSAVISAAIVGLVDAGMAPCEALDAVCGDGTHARLVSNLFDALSAKTA